MIFKAVGLVVAFVLALFGSDVANAQAAADVTAAAGDFTTFLTDNLPVIGGAILGGAALAVGWKWLKGMIFS